MASLVGPLASGIVGAPSGSVEFFTHGTSTVSTQVYSDANAQTAVTAHTLDSNGGIVRYVTEPVDVVVRNVAGSTVRQFTHIDDARLVRVNNALATGPNPNGNGQIVASGNATVHSLFTLLNTSLGADDGFVNINNVEYLIKTIISASGGVFFNVKSGYGARGDGTGNDLSAIQSAINAATNAGGGIVFFPPGKYRIAGQLTMSSTNMTLLGSGPGSGTDGTQIIQATTGLTSWLDITANHVKVEGIWFNGEVGTETGAVIRVAEVTDVSVENCFFSLFGGSAIVATRTLSGFGMIVVRLLNCFMSLTLATARFVGDSTNNQLCTIAFLGCTFFDSPASSVTPFDDSRCFFSGCTFSMSNSTGGVTLFAATCKMWLSACYLTTANSSGTNTLGGATLTLSACDIETTAAGTLAICAAGTVLREDGSSFTIDTTGPITLGDNTVAGTFSGTRDRRITPTTLNGTSYTPNVNFGVHQVTHASGASMAFANPTTNTAPHSPLEISYKNSTGGNLTPTWGTAFTGVPATAVNNGDTALYVFRNVNPLVANEWVCVTASVVTTAS